MGSDYFSQVSPRSFSSVGSDHDHERDHGELSAGGGHNSDDTSPSGNSDNDSGHHSLLSATKSYNHLSTNSCSFFRSPKLDIKVWRKNKNLIIFIFSLYWILTLFRLDGYQIDTCLPFSFYLLQGFLSESEQPYRNRVKFF